jgi:hypothetical protein
MSIHNLHGLNLQGCVEKLSGYSDAYIESTLWAEKSHTYSLPEIRIAIDSHRKLEEFRKNKGRRCRITESVIAGLTGREATITDAVGDQKKGFQYCVMIDTPLFSFTSKLDYYPHVFQVEIL